VSWTVQNQGQGEIRGKKWIDEIYLADTPTLNAPNANAWYLGSLDHEGDLLSGGTYHSWFAQNIERLKNYPVRAR
jgi:hypothetical protein